jgi:hypothetical protein
LYKVELRHARRRKEKKDAKGGKDAKFVGAESSPDTN